MWGWLQRNSSSPRSGGDELADGGRPAVRWLAGCALLPQQVVETIAGEGSLCLAQAALIGKGANLHPVPDFAIGQFGVFQAGIQSHQNDLCAHPVGFRSLAE